MSVSHYYLLRLTRRGPLVPARLVFLNHEPGVPDNLLDRGHRSIYPQADIGGEIVPPEELFDRLFAPSEGDFRPGHSPTHWRYAKPIGRAEYETRLRHLRWCEDNAPDHPTLRPRRPINPRTARLPSFGVPR
jgi:hypothetical protein